MIRPFTHILHADRDGASLLELSVAMPVLITIGMGAIEFGNFIYQRHLVENAVRDAARYAAGLPYDPDSETANDTLIKNMAVYGDDSAGTARVIGWLPADVTVTWDTVANGDCGGALCYRPPNADATDVPHVTISTDFAYDSLGFFGLIGLTAPTATLNASHQERVIGVR
jgi:Flp pilus assembly protein TadG